MLPLVSMHVAWSALLSGLCAASGRWIRGPLAVAVSPSLPHPLLTTFLRPSHFSPPGSFRDHSPFAAHPFCPLLTHPLLCDLLLSMCLPPLFHALAALLCLLSLLTSQLSVSIHPLHICLDAASSSNPRLMPYLLPSHRSCLLPHLALAPIAMPPSHLIPFFLSHPVPHPFILFTLSHFPPQ